MIIPTTQNVNKLTKNGQTPFCPGAAANLVPALSGDRNFNMETEGRTPNRWPSEGHTSTTTQNRWLHSDFKNAALPYVYQMYEAMIAKGSLK